MWERVKRRKGFILGDEMGMGKTRQVLEVIVKAWEENKRSILILAPVTLLRNWAQEMKKFNIQIENVIVHAQDKNIPFMLRDAEGHRIVLMGYELALKKRNTILREYFNLLILDEAQRIKNRATGISVICKKINAEVKICITGTPLQNSLSELWSLAETVRPGCLGDPDRFKAEIEEPMKRSKLKRATEEEKAKGDAISEHLKEILEDVILRRAKKDIFNEQMPPQMKEVIISCPLTETQQKMYNKALKEDQVQAAVLGNTSPLKTISALRRICAHSILEKSKSVSISKTRIKKTSTSNRIKSDTSNDTLLDSGKVQVVHKLLFQWRKKNKKVLIFSQYKEILLVLEELLSAPTKRIDGDTAPSKRMKIIEEFGKEKVTEVLLLTTKVGGIGVNIQKANTVILFDMDWNPFNDEQAKGRTHRMGQLQEVTIFRLICRGTIEDSISVCQQIKKDISSKVLEGAASKRLFEKIDLCRLFHYSYDPEDVTDISIY